MATVLSQNIPSELRDLWDNILRVWPWIGEYGGVGMRLPFRIPSLQGCRTIRPTVWRGWKVTDAMCAHRQVFGKCVECFNKQPYSGGVTPPAWGPRNRSWWYNDPENEGHWYYNWFMLKTIEGYIGGAPPVWCRKLITKTTYVNSEHPDANYHDEIILHAYEYGEITKRILIKRPEGITDWTLWIYVTATMAWGDGYPLIVNVRSISDNWDWETVDWDSQPERGAILQTLELTMAGGEGWKQLNVGSAPAIMIEIDEEDDGFIWVYSWRVINGVLRPWYSE